jgi:hypothetical protein
MIAVSPPPRPPFAERLLLAIAHLLAAVCVLAVIAALNSCGARQCRNVQIVVAPHPSQPRPAGRVMVGCDGRLLLEVDAQQVGP